MAAASASVLLAIANPASAASCATTAGDDTCIISLVNANTLDNHDGQGGNDTVIFGDGINSNYFYTNTDFTTANTARFRNFENAEVDISDSLSISDSSSSDAAQSLNWTVNGILELNNGSTATGDANDTIGNSSAMTVNLTGTLAVWENETIGALTLNGGNVILLNATQLNVASLNGTGTVTLTNTSVLAAGGQTTPPAGGFAGTIIGTGGINKTGTGKWILSGDNSYSGATTVSGGTLEIQHAGAIDQSSSVTIQGGGELTSKSVANFNLNGLTITSGRLTGNATVNGNVSSNGGLQPGNTSIPSGGTVENPGQDMGTINITGNYSATGINAYVGMFVDLDAAAPAGGTAGTTHDYLSITGNVLPGANPTTFAVASFLPSPTGIATTGNGIKVIHVGGTTSGNDFIQRNSLTAGPYQYLLRHVAAGSGYFLQSFTRDELIAHAALLSAGQELVRNCYHDGQRIPDSPKGATYGRAWIGYRQGSTDFGADTGIQSDVDFSCTTGGMDWRMGNGWFGGISGGFGDTEGNILTPAGNASYTGTGRSAEVFASFTSEALFINLSAGYNAMDYTYDGSLMFPVLAETQGLLARAETGVALDLDALAVKLIGAVSYDGTSCSDSCMGVAATGESGLLEARGTVRVDGVTHGGSVRPWIAASFSDVLSDGINSASLNGVTVSHDTSGQRLTIDGGLKAYLDQNFALYLDGGYHESLTTEVTGYKAGVGLKMYW